MASYMSPNAPNHWGVPALMGRWLIPADAPPGQDPARVVVLGYQFWQRYYSGDPGVVGRTIQLVRKNYQIVGVMPPRFRWREADIYMPLKVRFDPNIYYGVEPQDSAWRLDCGSQRRTAADPAAVRGCRRRVATRTTFRVNLRSIIELYARPMGPRLFLLLGAVDVAAAHGLRQRVDPAARARRASAAGTGRARGASAPDDCGSCGSC